jgi:serine/threonine protein kinase
MDKFELPEIWLDIL